MISIVNMGQNRKTGPVAATYAPIRQTCNPDCRFRDNGCYAQSGHVGMRNRVLELAADRRHAVTIARAEAAALDEMQPAYYGQGLRLHVSGDCRDTFSARILARAVSHWYSRGGGPAWTYTHSWREIEVGNWGRVNVFASCERQEDVLAATRRGYAVARAVKHHPADGKAWLGNALTWIPCPEQTRGIQCSNCCLCFNAERLLENGQGVTFAVHGQRKRRAAAVLG